MLAELLKHWHSRHIAHKIVLKHGYHGTLPELELRKPFLLPFYLLEFRIVQKCARLTDLSGISIRLARVEASKQCQQEQLLLFRAAAFIELDFH